MKKVKVSNIKEKAMEIVFLVSACISILSVALICVFLFTNGVPGIAKIGLKEFLLGTEWKPGSQLFGIIETGSGAAGRYSVCSIWFLWLDGTGSICP